MAIKATRVAAASEFCICFHERVFVTVNHLQVASFRFLRCMLWVQLSLADTFLNLQVQG